LDWRTGEEDLLDFLISSKGQPYRRSAFGQGSPLGGPGRTPLTATVGRTHGDGGEGRRWVVWVGDDRT
jgi:hypothetical protein